LILRTPVFSDYYINKRHPLLQGYENEQVFQQEKAGLISVNTIGKTNSQKTAGVN